VNEEQLIERIKASREIPATSSGIHIIKQSIRKSLPRYVSGRSKKYRVARSHPPALSLLAAWRWPLRADVLIPRLFFLLLCV
jgi:hypothetical protein